METQYNTEAIAEAEHTAFRVELRDGKRVFVLYGMIVVDDLAYARELLLDRRKTFPRYADPVLQAFELAYEPPRGHGLLEKFPWE